MKTNPLLVGKLDREPFLISAVLLEPTGERRIRRKHKNRLIKTQTTLKNKSIKMDAKAHKRGAGDRSLLLSLSKVYMER